MGIDEKAYFLWEAAGRPQTDGTEFWLEAQRRLSHRQWHVRSGELKIEGEGPLDEVVELALNYALNNCLALGEAITVSEKNNDKSISLETIPQLKSLGLWSE